MTFDQREWRPHVVPSHCEDVFPQAFQVALPGDVTQHDHAALEGAFRRTEHGFVREIHEGLDAVIPLREIDSELPLADVYDAVEFTPEPSEDETA